MALCVVQKTIGLASDVHLIVVNQTPCLGTLLLSETDLQSHLSYSEVSLLFASAVGLYATVFVFQLGRKSLGF